VRSLVNAIKSVASIEISITRRGATILPSRHPCRPLRLQESTTTGRFPRRSLGFSLQANAKTREGTSHPDRNAQFEYINAQVTAFQAAGAGDVG
jgi:hypothetical protein